MESYTKPTVTSCNKFLKNHQSFPYKKGKSLKDMLVRAQKKKKTVNRGFHTRIDVFGLSPFCTFWHNSFVSILAIIPAGCVLYNKCSQLSRQQLVPGAHQMEPPSPIQALGVNPFPSRFIIRTVPRGDFARRRWEEPITTTK